MNTFGKFYDFFDNHNSAFMVGSYYEKKLLYFNKNASSLFGINADEPITSLHSIFSLSKINI